MKRSWWFRLIPVLGYIADLEAQLDALKLERDRYLSQLLELTTGRALTDNRYPEETRGDYSPITPQVTPEQRLSQMERESYERREERLGNVTAKQYENWVKTGEWLDQELGVVPPSNDFSLTPPDDKAN